MEENIKKVIEAICFSAGRIVTIEELMLTLEISKNELDEIINNDEVIYHKGYTAGELRKLLIRNNVPEFIDGAELCKLTRSIVDLAGEGLDERGIGEEIFLKPLYERIKNYSNPGMQILESIQKGINIEEIIEDYGKLDISI